MELNGAAIQNFYGITREMHGNNEQTWYPKRVKVPHYQRPFQWEKDRICQLINDWASETQSNQTQRSYFSGSIVTVSHAHSHELIDGQQRFTTIYLTNYLRFLLCRVAIRQTISGGHFHYLGGLLNDLVESAKYIFCQDDFSDSTLSAFFDELKGYIDTSLDEDVERDEIYQHYCQCLAFPSDKVEADEDYVLEHSKRLRDFLLSKSMILSYDRSSFNAYLINVLACCRISLSDQSYPELHIDREANSDGENENEKRYAEALDTIFSRFSELLGKDNKPFNHTRSLIKLIGEFLSNLQLCVVQTGNARDAYTLFEVLNDRSLALDDLDLIKNQFYKNYVLKNVDKSDKEIDALLQQLDDQWVDRIFNRNNASEKKLVTYLATVYITGSTEVLYNKGDGYRDAISTYLENIEHYSDDDIAKDFNIFHACQIIVRSLGIRYRKTDVHALTKEYQDSSHLSQTAHFLSAMGQEGVLSGLVNFVLKYIETNNHGLGVDIDCSRFSPMLVQEVINQLIRPNDASDVQRQAESLWQCSMLSSTAKEPRELAVRIIENNFKASEKLSLIREPVTSAQEETFSEWLDGWRYHNNQLKVRILFARLIKLSPSKSGHGLSTSTFQLSIAEENVGKLQLDHLEPITPDNNNYSAFFEDEDRASLVNSIGNMMPLPNAENAKKSNAPMRFAFDYIENAGLPKSHYLVEGTIKLYRDNRNLDNETPNREFFTKRKAWLQQYFLQAIRYSSL